jgi:alanine dehydrogenase
MVAEMKKGAVLVDVAIDQGGCFETSRATTHANPTYEVDGVVHYCVANMPGSVPLTSSEALSHATFSRNGLNVHRGKITHRAVAESLGVPYADPADLAV